MAKVIKMLREDYEWIDSTKKNVAVVILLGLIVGSMTAGVLYVTYAVGNAHSNLVEALGE